jgi:hypothetical protein
MTSQGSAQARFQRAIKRGNVLNAEMAARELGKLSTAEALSLVLLYQREADPRFERAFRRWLGRARMEHALSHREVELLRAAAGALGSTSAAFGGIGLAVLVDACRALGLPPPTVPANADA